MPWKRARCKSSDLAKKVLTRQEPVPEEVERLNLLAGCWDTKSPQLARTEIWMIGDSILAFAWELGLADTDVDWESHSSMHVQELHSILQFGMLQGRCPSMIILHLGGNNIDNMNQRKNVNKIKSNVKYIFF